MYNFNAEEMKDRCVEWIRDFFKNNGPDCNAVVGISGGKDSSVVAALCVEALGKDRVIGVLMPCGVQADIDMARKLVNHLGIKNYEINVEAAVNGILNALPDIEISTQTKTNVLHYHHILLNSQSSLLKDYKYLPHDHLHSDLPHKVLSYEF